MKRTAVCSCGQLSVECGGEPASVSVCHCSACQGRTGSAFGAAAFFQHSDVHVSGDATSFARASDSGCTVTFHFCPTCGSTVHWQTSRKPEFTAVALGAFADPAFPAPTKAVYEELRHPWVRLTC